MPSSCLGCWVITGGLLQVGSLWRECQLARKVGRHIAIDIFNTVRFWRGIMGNLGMAAGHNMDLDNINSNLCDYKNSAKSPGSVASKALNQLEQQQSQKTVSLIQKSAPHVENGNVKLINLLA